MDFDGFDLSVRDGGGGGPAILDAVERNLWLDLYRARVLDAVEEQGIETRWYGPLQATVVAALPDAPLLNLLLGAAEPGAVGEGHLAQVLEWIDSLDLACPLAAAAMMVHYEVAAHLGFAATEESARGRGCHLALLHRAILDAAKSCPTLFAETTEPLGERDGPSAGCRNLLRAGFRQASVRPTWRRRHSVAELQQR